MGVLTNFVKFAGCLRKQSKMSKYKNPINDVGVIQVFGIDEPRALEKDAFRFVKEHDMTPPRFVEELKGMEKQIFSKMYAGRFARKLYRMYEYRKGEE